MMRLQSVKEKRELWVYSGVVFGMYLLFFVLQLFLQNTELVDSKQYLNLADNVLAEGKFYSWDLNEPIDMEGYTQRPPLYPFLILPFRLISDSVFPLLFLQCLLGTLNFVGLFLLWKRLDLKISPLWGAIPALLFYPAQLIYANLVMSEILFQTSIFWSFLFLTRFLESDRDRDLLWYALLICAGFLTKPVLYLWWIPNLVIVGWLTWRKKRAKLLIYAVIPALGVMLYCGVNYLRTDYYHFSSISAINLLNYNAYHSLLETEGAEKADSIVLAIRDEAFELETFPEQEKYMEDAAKKIMIEHSGAYLKFHAKGMVNFFMDPGRFDLYHFFGWGDENFKGLLYYFSKDGYAGIFKFLREQPAGPAIMLVSVMAWNLLILLAFGLFMLTKGVRWEVKLLALMYVGYICAATGPLGASRFKVPVYPIMVLGLPFAIQGAKNLFLRFRRNRTS